MKILICTPDLNGIGGVSIHYKGLIPYWTQDVRYYSIGKKKWRKLKTPFLVIMYIFRLITFRPNMIVVNPSLQRSALARDFLYLNFARILGFKVSVFIHGFNLDYAEIADWNWICRNLNKASHILVLAQQFKDILVEHGVTTDIQLSTTKVPDDMIRDFDPNVRTGEINNILFLSRMVRAKGVYEAVDTYALLKKNHPHIKMKMVGAGSELNALKQYVADRHVDGITFTGALSGQDIVDVYKEADLFLFTTSHGEGMPTVVLEAMAFGLPVITRYVGGLCDFFEDGKMGCITNSLDPKDFAKMIDSLIDNQALCKEISLFNHNYAIEHFLASEVAKQLETVLL